MAIKFRISPAVVMIAVLATFVLGSSVLSGEHPWDTDRSTHHTGAPGTPDTATVVDPTDAARYTRIDGTSADESSASVVDYLRVVAFQIARSYGVWFRSSGRNGSDSSRW